MTEESRQRHAAWFAAAFGVIVAVALAMPGMARAAAIADPDDVHGKLDIASVSQEHAAAGPVVHTITTYGPWRSRAIALRRSSFFLIDFGLGRVAEPNPSSRPLRVITATRRTPWLR